MKHTEGAIRAAEAITGLKYGNPKLHFTAYGRKTVEGIADIIDKETVAWKLLALVRGYRLSYPLDSYADKADEIIAKAGGGK